MAFKIIDRELERCQDWLGDRTHGVGYDILQAIGLERDGELVAVTGYNAFSKKSCQIHFAIDKGAYPPREYIWFVHYYPFIQAGLEVLIGMISTTNAAIVNLTRRLGYVEQCLIAEADLIVTTMHRHQCKWLELNNGRK